MSKANRFCLAWLVCVALTTMLAACHHAPKPPTNQPPQADAGPDQTITLPATARLKGKILDDGLPAGGTLSASWTKQSGSGTVTFANPAAAGTTATFSEPGTYVLRLSATDTVLSSSDDLTVTVNPNVPTNRAPQANAGPDQTITLPATAALKGKISDDGLPAGGTLTSAWTKQSGPGNVTFGSLSAVESTAAFSVAGTYVLRLTANDSALSSSDNITVTVNPLDTGLPPDPATVATPIDPTVATDIASSTSFLYTGANPIQTGVAPGTIESRRVAVLRGKVQGRDGSALPGVTITVLSHPELGQTLSRADGAFDLAVNGGGRLTLHYAKNGFLAVQRGVVAPWRDYAWLPDVVMVPLDTTVTTVALNSSSLQTARGSEVSDADGARRATILFPPGTTATMVLPNGTTQTITTLNVRATEYTVGKAGPKAMPAALPPSSGYTYAAELSVDQALAAGATEVRFNQALPVYVENFLGFPVGTPVPTGYYDRQKGQWVPSADGRVIKLLSITNGMADLDLDGAGVAADAAALTRLGITDQERTRLALLYTAGQTFWRTPVTHFSPWDFNWPFAPPNDAIGPSAPTGTENPPVDNQNEECGSVIGCEKQTLGESVPVTGTPWRLHYQSERVPGRKDATRMNIPVFGVTRVPAGLKRIELEISVAGQKVTQMFSPAPNQSYLFEWDGKDAFGRRVQGATPATVTVGYVYGGVYLKPSERPGREYESLFGHWSYYGTPVSGNRERAEVTLWRSWTELMRSEDVSAFGMGGWSLGIQHAYDTTGRRLLLGDGRMRRADAIASYTIETVAGTGVQGFSGDGGPAREAKLNNVREVAVSPDGSLFIADQGNQRIRRVGPDGLITTVAGTGVYGHSGDGGPATAAQLFDPHGVAVGPDGSLFIGDYDNHRIRRVGPDGIITTVAGTGVPGFTGDNGPATQAQLHNPAGVAVDSDGSLFIADTENHRIRRVRSDGIITTVTGDGFCQTGGDGGPATAAQVCRPTGVTVGADGSLFIAASGNQRIRRVGPDGIITTVAGTGVGGFGGDGGPATAALLHAPSSIAEGPDGSLFIADLNNIRIRRVGPDGVITTVAGTGLHGYSGDGGSPIAAQITPPTGVALGPDGNLYIADYVNRRIRRIRSALPGLSASDIGIPSEDGSELYIFKNTGRHLKTLDALTGALRYQFTYSTGGYLTSITDGSGNVTTVERTGAIPTAIVAPGGQRTALNVGADGWLLGMTNPAGEAHTMRYSTGGLLQTFTDPRGNLHRFTYDPLGRLIKNEDPAGGSTTLSRTQQSNGYTVTTTSALGLVRTYQVEQLPTRALRRTVTAPSGAKTVTVIGADGSEQTTYPDGSSSTVTYGPDPRWGMLARLPKTVSTTTGGMTANLTTTRTASLANPNDLLSLTELTDTTKLNDRTFTTVFDAATKTATSTSAAGRQSKAVIDSLGRVESAQLGGLLASTLSYDSPRGRLATVTQGTGLDARTATLSYNPDNTLSLVTDPLGRKLGFTYDTAGRVTSQTLPDGRAIAYGYDANGNLTSLTPPGRPGHLFRYTARDQTAEYKPPLVASTGSTLYDYDLNKSLTKITRPDGQTLSFEYDTAGRLQTLTLPNGKLGYGYDATTGRLTGITAQDATLAYTYNGALLTKSAWTGFVTGQVERAYDNDFRVTSLSVNGANPIAFQYDADSLLTKAGDLILTRSGQNGLLTGTGLVGVADSYAYDGFGVVTAYEAKANASSLLRFEYTYDKLSRITQKNEIRGGTRHTFDYGYDTAGRLTEVKRDGTVTASYGYDTNGNRTHLNGAPIAHYDAQDRLLDYQGATYQYSANGELQQKSAGSQVTKYSYDVLGNLRKVTFPNGTVIDYVIDGHNRRIGKKIGGTLTQTFLYQSQLRPIAELNGTGTVVSRFVYATGVNVPDYMIKGGVTYRIVKDHLGSPRVVVDVATNTVAQEMEYDAFGNVTKDTNPGFQPFGFAGGLYDRDTKLVRFGARDYDAETGRWTAKDPISFLGGTSNLYEYALNNPVTLIDPQGRSYKNWKNKIAAMVAAIEMYLNEGKSKLGADLVKRQQTEEMNRRLKQAQEAKKKTPGGAACVVPIVPLGDPPFSEPSRNLWEVILDANNDGEIDGNDAIEWLNPDPFFSWQELQEMGRQLGPGYIPNNGNI